MANPNSNNQTHDIHNNLLKSFYVKANIPFEYATKKSLKIYDYVSRSFCTKQIPINDSQTKFLSELESIFSSDSNISRIKNFTHSIRLKKSTPIAMKPYPKSHTQSKIIREITEDLLNKGLIRHSSSPYASPVSLVSKKDTNEMRLVIDYRRLNAITIPDATPLPNIQKILNCSLNAQIFSKLDMKSGYWQVPMNKADIEKTAFVTEDGHYEWTVMAFGLKTAPATFQRIVNFVLKDFLFKFVIVYLDDFLVYSNSEEEHREHLKLIFEKLQQAGITLSLNKCKFFQTQIEYLGHTLSHKTIRPSKNLVNAVKQFPQPQSQKEIQRFLGLAGYFRKYIKKFSIIAAPLTDLLKNNTSFVWLNTHQNSFNSLKNSLVDDTLLSNFDPNLDTFLHTDACGIGLGSVLIQNDGKRDFVVGYYSRKFNEHEKRYHTTEQECLAIVDSLDHFHIYLYGSLFTIITDHSALQWLSKTKERNNRLYRWSLRLSNYDYKIIHKPGKQNLVPDALSRAPVDTPKIFHISNAIVKQLQTHLSAGETTSCTSQDNIFIDKNKKIIIPDSQLQKLFEAYHDQMNHPGQAKMISTLTAMFYSPKLRQKIIDYVRSCHLCQICKHPNRPTWGVLNPIPTPSQPFKIISTDTIVLGNLAKNCKFKYIQTFIDHHSRYLWAFATAKNCSQTVLNCLQQIVTNFQAPEILISDNYKSYQSKQLHTYTKRHKVTHIYTTPYHPSSNGLVEKANHTVMSALRLLHIQHPKRKCSSLLPIAVQNYNKTVHIATKFTPHHLMFGIELSPLPSQLSINDIREIARQNSELFKQTFKNRHDKKHPSHSLNLNDIVLKKIPTNIPQYSKISPLFEGPYKIVKFTSELTVILQDIDEPLITVLFKDIHGEYIQKIIKPKCNKKTSEIFQNQKKAYWMPNISLLAKVEISFLSKTPKKKKNTTFLWLSLVNMNVTCFAFSANFVFILFVVIAPKIVYLVDFAFIFTDYHHHLIFCLHLNSHKTTN